MAEQYHGMAIGIFELDSECACFVALDAAAKAAAVQIQGVERKLRWKWRSGRQSQSQRLFHTR